MKEQSPTLGPTQRKFDMMTIYCEAMTFSRSDWDIFAQCPPMTRRLS